ncbi:MAG: hypothetical protein HN353_06110 [Bdellovibrionales bacterium]|jgi:hypothetical protein|nr:hypothetical protein [Bdellovibrionales bacterium]MBT3527034.1 hypothetical protein [Bdellovibrionales bacterium]MBT7669055.1 hypothetical protein [Bdellovibrionales bacterium]MBT7768045.1 hypothetical protein [Bdellovibrionales bacterium]
MNESLDKLIIRVAFTLFICLMLLLYKYVHRFLYPSSKSQMFRLFYPSKNTADTIHLFARLIGIGVIFSGFFFHLSGGMAMAFFNFFVVGLASFILYLVSIYILDSIAFYNFEYLTEIIKRKNISYALVSFTNAIAVAYLVKTVVKVSGSSLILMVILWLFGVVMIGISIKAFSFFSNLSFNSLMVQKSVSLSLAYLGFIWGWTAIIISALDHPIQNIQWYVAQVVLKILLSIIIFPLFKKGLQVIFQLRDDLDLERATGDGPSRLLTGESVAGYGVYQGGVFFISCFLTTVISGNINFGTFYPII